MCRHIYMYIILMVLLVGSYIELNAGSDGGQVVIFNDS